MASLFPLIAKGRLRRRILDLVRAMVGLPDIIEPLGPWPFNLSQRLRR